MAASAVAALVVADYNAVAGDVVEVNPVLIDDAVAAVAGDCGTVGDGEDYDDVLGVVGGEQVVDEPDSAVVVVEAGDVEM